MSGQELTPVPLVRPADDAARAQLRRAWATLDEATRRRLWAHDPTLREWAASVLNPAERMGP